MEKFSERVYPEVKLCDYEVRIKRAEPDVVVVLPVTVTLRIEPTLFSKEAVTPVSLKTALCCPNTTAPVVGLMLNAACPITPLPSL